MFQVLHGGVRVVDALNKGKGSGWQTLAAGSGRSLRMPAGSVPSIPQSIGCIACLHTGSGRTASCATPPPLRAFPVAADDAQHRPPRLQGGQRAVQGGAAGAAAGGMSQRAPLCAIACPLRVYMPRAPTAPAGVCLCDVPLLHRQPPARHAGLCFACASFVSGRPGAPILSPPGCLCLSARRRPAPACVLSCHRYPPARAPPATAMCSCTAPLQVSYWLYMQRAGQRFAGSGRGGRPGRQAGRQAGSCACTGIGVCACARLSGHWHMQGRCGYTPSGSIAGTRCRTCKGGQGR